MPDWRKFYSNVEYPRNEKGWEYIEVEAEVLSYEVIEEEFISFDLKCKEEEFTAYMGYHRMNWSTKPKKATARLFNWGGGFYPDDRVLALSWSD